MISSWTERSIADFSPRFLRAVSTSPDGPTISRAAGRSCAVTTATTPGCASARAVSPTAKKPVPVSPTGESGRWPTCFARDDGGYYDRFRGRVVFPIRDHQGRTLGFGGRVLDDGVPKYLNSPQTPVFDKSRTLYGLDNAARGIRAADRAIIVEGYGLTESSPVVSARVRRMKVSPISPRVAIMDTGMCQLMMRL